MSTELCTCKIYFVWKIFNTLNRQFAIGTKLLSSKINIRKYKIYNTHAHKLLMLGAGTPTNLHSGQTLLTSGSSRRLYSHNLQAGLSCAHCSF